MGSWHERGHASDQAADVIVYGGKLDFDYGKTEVIYFENKVTENWKNDRHD